VVHARDCERVCFEAGVSQLPPRRDAGYDAQVSTLTGLPADRPVCGAGEGDSKETRGEILNVGVSDGARAALEDGSIEDEDAGEPKETVNTPDEERWPDVVLEGSADEGSEDGVGGQEDGM